MGCVEGALRLRAAWAAPGSTAADARRSAQGATRGRGKITHAAGATLRGRPALAALLVAIGFLVLYIYTLAPAVTWGDEAKFQLLVPRLELEASEVGHPLWVLLSYPFTLLPAGDLAWRVNLATAVFGAAAVFFVYLSAGALFRHRGGSLAAAIAFGVSHTFWSLSVRPQSHSLNALFLALTLWLVFRWQGKLWQLYAAGFLFGLGLTNHFLLAFSLPGLAWFVIRTARARQVPLLRAAASLIFAGLGFAPFLITMLAQSRTGNTWFTVASYFMHLLSLESPVRSFALWAGFLAYNFAGPALILIGLGAIRLWRLERAIFIGLALLYLGNVYFVFDLALPDQYKYYIPSYLVLSLFAAPGFIAVSERASRKLSALLLAALLITPPLVYQAAPAIVRAAGFDELLGARNLPGRDMLSFFLTPSKRGYFGARDYARRALAQVEPGATIVADHTPYMALRYVQQAEGLRPDVTLVYLYPEAGFPFAPGRRDIYLADTQNYYPTEDIGRSFRIEQAGVLYRLVPKGQEP